MTPYNLLILIVLVIAIAALYKERSIAAVGLTVLAIVLLAFGVR